MRAIPKDVTSDHVRRDAMQRPFQGAQPRQRRGGQDASFRLFALGRSIGWAAHVIEQAGHDAIIRPRARYVGPGPGESEKGPAE